MADVSFASPAEIEGNLQAAHGTWIALAGHEDGVRFGARLGSGSLTNHTYPVFSPAYTDVSFRPEVSAPATTLAASEITGSLGRGGSLYLEADDIALLGGGKYAAVAAQGMCLDAYLTKPELQSMPFRNECPLDGVTVTALNVSVEIHVSGIHRIEWHQADLTCTPSCPPDAHTFSPPGDQPFKQVLVFEDLLPGSGNLSASGRVDRLLLGAPSLAVDVAGTARLPVATASHCACSARNQTLAIEGNITFQDLRPDGPGMAAHMATDDTSLFRVDEQDLPLNKVLVGSGIVVAAGVTATVWRLLVLFTRQLKDPLQNLRRRAIHEFISLNQGATLRDIIRGTQGGDGATRHHLQTLVRTRHLVEHTDKGRRRFFTDTCLSRAAASALRDRNVAALFEWFQQNQEANWALIRAAHPWPESTLHRRLASLVEAGLLVRAFPGYRLVSTTSVVVPTLSS